MKIINEKDWKLFIEKLPNWQEKYMERLVVDEYIKLMYSGNSISDNYPGIKDSLKSESPDVFTKDIKRAWKQSRKTLLQNSHVLTQNYLNKIQILSTTGFHCFTITDSILIILFQPI